MKFRFVKFINRLNISDTTHVTVVNILLYKTQLKHHCFCHCCWLCNEFGCYTMLVSSLRKCSQLKNIQRPQKIHS